ncbi:MAG: hypothetical protein ACOX6T_07920 [Myxococcales bacterium]
MTDNGDGTKTIACTDGTSVTVHDGQNGEDGADGQNGTSCTVTDNGDGTKTIACTDGTSVTVRDGQDGEDGADGQDGVCAGNRAPVIESVVVVAPNEAYQRLTIQATDADNDQLSYQLIGSSGVFHATEQAHVFDFEAVAAGPFTYTVIVSDGCQLALASGVIDAEPPSRPPGLASAPTCRRRWPSPTPTSRSTRARRTWPISPKEPRSSE